MKTLFMLLFVGACCSPCEVEVIHDTVYYPKDGMIINGCDSIGNNIILNLDSTFVVRSGFYGSGEPYLIFTKK